RRVLAFIYGPAVLFLIAMLICYIAVRQLYEPDRIADISVPIGVLFRKIVWVYFPVAGLWYVAIVAALVQSYRHAADAVERNQVKWIVLGAVAATVPLGYSLYLTLFDPTAFGKGDATWPMFAASACFTVAFTISITRYRLMQLDQIISSPVG